MSTQCIILNEELEELVCSSCGNYLSIFPVYLNNNDAATDTSAICGRCTPEAITGNKFIRDEAYEAVAQFLLFPCCYKKFGCREQLTPLNLEKHEITCSFLMFDCHTKFHTECQWQGSSIDIVKHFEENHAFYLLKPYQFDRWHFNLSYKRNLLLPFKNELFIITKVSDASKQRITYSVQLLSAKVKSSKYNYIMKLLSANKKCSYNLPQKTVNSKECITLSYNYVKERLQNLKYVLVCFEIVETEGQEGKIETEISKRNKNPNLNWDVLNELMCSVCFDLMHSPIFQCNGGHNICRKCKSTVKACDICKENNEYSRNYALEKLTIFLIYPCKFYKHGCLYTARHKGIKEHEEVCEYGPYECPLKHLEKCYTKINMDELPTHIEENHETYIIKSNKITVAFKNYETKESLHLITFSGSVFLIRCVYVDLKFYWTVQLIGPSAECKKYKFNIDIIDNSKRNLKCYINGFCTPIQEKVSFDEPHNFVMLTYEQLRELVSEKLDYRIYISVDTRH